MYFISGVYSKYCLIFHLLGYKINSDSSITRAQSTITWPTLSIKLFKFISLMSQCIWGKECNRGRGLKPTPIVRAAPNRAAAQGPSAPISWNTLCLFWTVLPSIVTKIVYRSLKSYSCRREISTSATVSVIIHWCLNCIKLWKATIGAWHGNRNAQHCCQHSKLISVKNPINHF